MPRQTRAYLYAAFAVLAWSTVASAFKLCLTRITPTQLLLISAATSTAVLFAVLAIRGKLSLLRANTAADWGRSALLGLLNPALYYLVLFEAYARLPGQVAQPLNFTWAVTLALLSIPLLGQRIPLAGLGALGISFVGVWVLSTRGDPLSFRLEEPVGVALALGSSVLWAFYWILNLRDPRDAVVKLACGFLCGTVAIAVFAALTGELRAPDGVGLLGGIYVGLFEMGLTFVLWLEALRLSRTTAQVSNLIFLAPFLSLILLNRVAGEAIHPSSVLGLFLIVAGIVIQKRIGDRDGAGGAGA